MQFHKKTIFLLGLIAALLAANNSRAGWREDVYCRAFPESCYGWFDDILNNTASQCFVKYALMEPPQGIGLIENNFTHQPNLYQTELDFERDYSFIDFDPSESVFDRLGAAGYTGALAGRMEIAPTPNIVAYCEGQGDISTCPVYFMYPEKIDREETEPPEQFPPFLMQYALYGYGALAVAGPNQEARLKLTLPGGIAAPSGIEFMARAGRIYTEASKNILSDAWAELIIHYAEGNQVSEELEFPTECSPTAQFQTTELTRNFSPEDVMKVGICDYKSFDKEINAPSSNSDTMTIDVTVKSSWAFDIPPLRYGEREYDLTPVYAIAIDDVRLTPPLPPQITCDTYYTFKGWKVPCQLTYNGQPVPSRYYFFRIRKEGDAVFERIVAPDSEGRLDFAMNDPGFYNIEGVCIYDTGGEKFFCGKTDDMARVWVSTESCPADGGGGSSEPPDAVIEPGMSTIDLIERDYQNGLIDQETALVYKLMYVFNSGALRNNPDTARYINTADSQANADDFCAYHIFAEVERFLDENPDKKEIFEYFFIFPDDGSNAPTSWRKDLKNAFIKSAFASDGGLETFTIRDTCNGGRSVSITTEIPRETVVSINRRTNPVTYLTEPHPLRMELENYMNCTNQVELDGICPEAVYGNRGIEIVYNKDNNGSYLAEQVERAIRDGRITCKLLENTERTGRLVPMGTEGPFQIFLVNTMGYNFTTIPKVGEGNNVYLSRPNISSDEIADFGDGITRTIHKEKWLRGVVAHELYHAAENGAGYTPGRNKRQYGSRKLAEAIATFFEDIVFHDDNAEFKFAKWLIKETELHFIPETLRSGMILNPFGFLEDMRIPYSRYLYFAWEMEQFTRHKMWEFTKNVSRMRVGLIDDGSEEAFGETFRLDGPSPSIKWAQFHAALLNPVKPDQYPINRAFASFQKYDSEYPEHATIDFSTSIPVLLDVDPDKNIDDVNPVIQIRDLISLSATYHLIHLKDWRSTKYLEMKISSPDNTMTREDTSLALFLIKHSDRERVEHWSDAKLDDDYQILEFPRHFGPDDHLRICFDELPEPPDALVLITGNVMFKPKDKQCICHGLEECGSALCRNIMNGEVRMKTAVTCGPMGEFNYRFKDSGSYSDSFSNSAGSESYNLEWSIDNTLDINGKLMPSPNDPFVIIPNPSESYESWSVNEHYTDDGTSCLTGGSCCSIIRSSSVIGSGGGQPEVDGCVGFRIHDCNDQGDCLMNIWLDCPVVGGGIGVSYSEHSCLGEFSEHRQIDDIIRQPKRADDIPFNLWRQKVVSGCVPAPTDNSEAWTFTNYTPGGYKEGEFCWTIYFDDDATPDDPLPGGEPGV